MPTSIQSSNRNEITFHFPTKAITAITLSVAALTVVTLGVAIRSHSSLIQWVANDLGAFVNTTQTQPSMIIDQMVALRKQLAQLEAQIEVLKPAFFRNRTSQRRLNRTALLN